MADELVTRRSVIGGLPTKPETAPAAGGEGTRGEASSAAASLSVEVFEDPAALEPHREAWEQLAADALEPNPFYEPWMLLPALRAYGAGDRLQIVLVTDRDPARPLGPRRLCGVFPLERAERYTGLSRPLPVATLRFWRKTETTYLCNPLLRAELARETLEAFFAWVSAGSHGCPLLELNFVAGEGPFQQLLIDRFNERQTLTCVTDAFTRALLRTGTDPETHLRGALGRFRLKEFRRQERRLAEGGRLEYRALEPGDDVDAWIEDFLRVEEISWKGKGGRALTRNQTDREYFRTIAREAFSRGKLMLLALAFEGRTIAAKCNFLSGPGAFAYKIAFDEAYAKHSPGVLLEFENIRRLHARPETRWMDSCADAIHPMINRLWPERRTIQSLVLPTGRRPGMLVVAGIPLLKWLNRLVFRRDLRHP